MLWADQEDELDVRLIWGIVAVVSVLMAAFVLAMLLYLDLQIGNIFSRITSELMGAALLPLLQGPMIYHPSMDEEREIERRKKMWQSNEGQSSVSLIGYALILLFLALVVIAIIFLLGPQIGNIFSQISTGIGLMG